MNDQVPGRLTTRRQFLRSTSFLAVAALAAACAPAAPPAPTTGPAKPAEAAKPAEVSAAKPGDVPRNRTLVLMYQGVQGKWVDHELWNCYAIGANHQLGSGIFYEPLAFYSAFADKEYLWLAESYKYSPDFKELTIKTRSGIKWSDGVDFSAEDVAFTLTSLQELGPKVRWGIDVQQFVQEAKATDKNTVVVKFKVPAPRFFYHMTYKYDIGVYIVPRHIFQDQDWTKFKHYDIAKGWPVTTGPWKLVFASPEQKIMDRRNEWWAASAGLAKLPRVERQIWLPTGGEQQTAQALITNQIDMSNSLLPATWPTIFQQNPKVITHSFQKLPYGYMDWFPHSLYVNNEKPPFDDKDIRWALSSYIDRQQIVDVAWGGAAEVSPFPMPYYPPLRPYIDGIKDLIQQYNTLEFNPKKGDEILTRKGWKKDSGGFWADSQGNRFKLEIIGFGSTINAVGPVISELLKRQGIEATFAGPPDFDDRFQKGNYTGAIYGHGGSVSDPYNTLRLYQSSTTAVPGAHQANFSRWKNAEYDKIVDEVYQTDMAARDKLMQLFRKALEIWLPELPDIPLTYNYHRMGMNTTYWTNYPTEQNPYVNAANWHLTFPIVLWNLEPTQ